MDSENLLRSARILIVDDDSNLRQILVSQLIQQGVINLDQAETAEQTHEKIASFKPDLLILDVELPDGNGFDICHDLRSQGFEKPIIMLTGQAKESHIIEGLGKGANDYIAKPMRFGELLARIKAQLRQYKASDDVRFTAQGLDFIPANKTISCDKTQRVVTLTEKETLILKKLFRIAPESSSRQDLLLEVWGYQKDLSTHTLETHIYRLRQKIARISKTQLIETACDGYRLNKSKRR